VKSNSNPYVLHQGLTAQYSLKIFKRPHINCKKPVSAAQDNKCVSSTCIRLSLQIAEGGEANHPIEAIGWTLLYQEHEVSHNLPK
jgi:hypothetical protein